MLLVNLLITSFVPQPQTMVADDVGLISMLDSVTNLSIDISNY